MAVVVVMGATGVGKTRLSLALARAFGGEIVNADALQMYEGLDIATNKATAAERAVAPHHLLACIPATTAITVHQFCQLALAAVCGPLSLDVF